MSDNGDSRVITEQQNPKTRQIDSLSVVDMLRVMNEEDQQVAHAVKAVIPDVARAVELVVASFEAGGRLIYVGAGTSGRLGVLDAVECVPTFGIDPSMVQGVIAGGERAFVRSIEGAEDDRDAAQRDMQALNIDAHDTVVGIAASGQTPYVIQAVNTARELGAATVGIACNVPSDLLGAADVAIGVQVGPEVITGSTRLKAGTAQKLVLNMLSTAAMVRVGKVYGNLMVDVQVTNDKLYRRACRIIAAIAEVDDAESERLLEASGRQVKVAIVMSRLGVTRAEAEAALKRVSGRLREVIG